MTILSVESTTDEAADRINRIHAETYAHAERVMEKAIECGEQLAAKKDELDHGQWIPWVEANLTFTVRHAQRYMEIAANKTRVSHLGSIRAAVKLLAEPETPAEPEEPGDVAGDPLEFNNDPELEERAQEAEQRAGDLDRTLRDVDQDLTQARNELSELRKLKADKEKIESAMLELHELENRKLDLFADAESTKLVHQVLLRSREYFTRECMQIPALVLTPESIRVMRQDFEGLVELVENWSAAIKHRFLEAPDE